MLLNGTFHGGSLDGIGVADSLDDWGWEADVPGAADANHEGRSAIVGHGVGEGGVKPGSAGGEGSSAGKDDAGSEDPRVGAGSAGDASVGILPCGARGATRL